MRSAAEIQQAYYAETADKYDELHNQDRDEHGLGLAYMMAMVEFSASARFWMSVAGLVLCCSN
jgi:hypothetical protein